MNTPNANCRTQSQSNEHPLLWAVVAAAYLSGCSTMNPIMLAIDDVSATLRVGEKISVREKNDAVHQFEITRLTPKEVCGPTACVALRDVASLERSEFSAAKTTGLILGTVVLIGFAALLRNASGIFLAP